MEKTYYCSRGYLDTLYHIKTTTDITLCGEFAYTLYDKELKSFKDCLTPHCKTCYEKFYDLCTDKPIRYYFCQSDSGVVDHAGRLFPPGIYKSLCGLVPNSISFDKEIKGLFDFSIGVVSCIECIKVLTKEFNDNYKTSIDSSIKTLQKLTYDPNINDLQKTYTEDPQFKDYYVDLYNGKYTPNKFGKLTTSVLDKTSVIKSPATLPIRKFKKG